MVVVVEGKQLGVALECVEAARAPAEPACRSVGVRRFAIARKVRADVIEHTVEQYPQAATVRLGYEVVEVGVITKPGIDAVVVGGVVAMGARGEDRSRVR